MDYTLSLTRPASETLREHLLADRSREQMAITLCGVNQLHNQTRLLVRDVILLPADAFRRQGAALLDVKPEVQSYIHQRASRHGLIQVDWHSHPGGGYHVGFSSTDDHFEAQQAVYLAHRMGGVPYGSVVVNDDGLDARLWLAQVVAPASAKAAHAAHEPGTLTYHARPLPIQAVFTGDLERRIPSSSPLLEDRPAFVSPIFDRQVRAFGVELQRKLSQLRIGVVGLGGLGSAMVEYLGRLGVRDWVMVDPDTVEVPNLNRLVHASVADARRARPKINVARSSVRSVSPRAHVRLLRTDVFDPQALHALKSCDLLIVATDNHSSRMVLNRLAVQYLIPLVHVGFNISVEEAAARGGTHRQVTDVSGEFAIPELGRWCLQCAGIVDPQQAGWELASPAQRAILRQRGYVSDTPAPAVRHLDGLVAALATAEIHNLVQSFKPVRRYLSYDALRTELLPLQVTPSESCPICGSEGGVLGLGDLEPMPDYRRASQVQLPPLPRPKPASEPDAEAAPPMPAQAEAVQVLLPALPSAGTPSAAAATVLPHQLEDTALRWD